MDAARINAKVYAGRGKAALRVGTDCSIYRPLNSSNPYTSKVGTLKAAFNSGDSNYLKPNLYGHPVWYADLDGAQVAEGDILVRVSDQNVWFVAAKQSLLPIVVIECPRAVKLSRPAPSSAVGLTTYSGLQPSSMMDAAGSVDSPWPASILLGGKAAPSANLPSGVSEGGWRILLPPSFPVAVLPADVLTDDLGRTYTVVMAEQTDLGWRINASEAHV